MSESGGFVAYAGTLLGLAGDPAIAIGGGLLGLAAWTWWQRIIGALVLAFALTYLVTLGAELEGGPPGWWALTSRAIMLFGWASVGAGLRWVLSQFH